MPSPTDVEVKALLDTGATISGISRSLVDRLNLQSNGWRSLEGAHGTEDVLVYQVGLFLPITTIGAETMTTFASGGEGEVAELAMLAKAEYEVVLGMNFRRLSS